MSVKITELPILDSLADNDIVAGVDVSGNVTSKIEMSTLKNYIDTNTQYTAGTNIDITNNVISAPDVYNKDEMDNQIEELQNEVESLSTIFNAFPTESGEGESFTLDDTAEVKFKKFDLKGNTSQTTYSGKNMFSTSMLPVTEYGITISKNANGDIVLNGTPNYNEGFKTFYTGDVITVEGGTYTLSVANKKIGIGTVVGGFNGGCNLTLTDTVASKTAYADTSQNVNPAINIRYDVGTLNNFILNPQMEKSSSATTYEQFVGGTVSPNPSYPQPVNVASGDNEIEICGKNLYNSSDTTYYQTCTYVSGANTNQYKVKATGTDVIINLQVSSGTSYSSTAGTLIPCKYGETIYYDIGNSNFGKNIVTQYNANKVSLGFSALNTGSSSGSYTPNNSECEYISIRIGNGSATSGTEYTLAPIFSKTSNLTYEPYIGNTYNIDLPVENLLPISSLASTTSNGITFTNNNDGTYTLNGTATAEATFYIFGGNTEIKANSKLTFSCKELIEGTRIFWYDNWAIINGAEQRIGSGKPNYTTTNEITTISQLRVNISVVSGTTVNNLTIKPMIEKGSKANSYTPYGTIPIELCKIGNYQDYFYKGEGYNLLPNNATTQTINGVTFKVNDDKSVTLNGTASAIADFYMYGSSTDTGEYLYIPKGTYSISNPSSGWFYIGREKTLGAVVGNSALLNALSSQDCYFYGFIIRATSGSSLSNLTLYPMINEGSTALPYEPYGSKDKWLLHKEIGKSDLKDEGMVLQSINDYGIANFLVQPIETNVLDTSKIENSLCNRFSRQTTGIAQTQTEGFLRTLNAGIGQLGVYIRISSDKANTVATFKTWLENNPTYYYWALYTPTNTEITYQPLIDQLNELEKAISYENQTNISQVNNDKPFILDVTAIKSLQNILDRIELLES